MDNRGVKCSRCGHKRSAHRHYNSVWKMIEEDERVVDKKAKKKYLEATNEKDKKEAMKERAQKAIDELTREIEGAITQLGRLAEEYANLSLSGSFSGQVEKSIDLMEFNIAAMQENGADSEIIKKLETCMASMQAKLDVLKEARQKAEKPNIVILTEVSSRKLSKHV